MTQETGKVIHQPNKWLVFFLVSAGVFFSTMDSSMVNISLPYIMDDFKSSLGETGWVVLIYLLTTSVTMLFWGHLAQRLGRENLYTAGLFIFGTGSFFCSRATGLDVLVGCRFFQGLGAAMMMANGPAMLKSAFGSERLGRSLGLMGIATALGLMVGPAVGGFIIEYHSWQTLFLLPVPICGAAGLISLKTLNRPVPPDSSQPFDWLGGVWWGLLLTASTYTLSLAADHAVQLERLILGTMLSIIALLLFIRRESRLSLNTDATSPLPLIPTKLFQQRSIFIGSTTVTLVFLCLFSVLILTPFYLRLVLQISSSKIGMVMMAIPITALITAPIAGWLADKTNARIVATFGLTLCTIGLFLFTTLSVTTPPLAVALRLTCFGIGLSLFLSPNATMVLRQTEDRHMGTVSALLATGRTLGMLAGISLASFAFSLFFSDFTGGLDIRSYSAQHAASFIMSMRYSYYCFIGIGVTAVLLSAFETAEKPDRCT